MRGSSRLSFSSWHPYYTTLCGICQGVFEKFFKNFFEPCKVSLSNATRSCYRAPRPLTLLLYHFCAAKSIPFWKVFSICANCTIPGFKFVESLCNFSLDKLLGVWYNGNNAPQERGRRVEKPPPTFCRGRFFFISTQSKNFLHLPRALLHADSTPSGSWLLK